MAQREPSLQIDAFLYGVKAAALLQIAADGTVNGTLDTTSKYGRKEDAI